MRVVATTQNSEPRCTRGGANQAHHHALPALGGARTAVVAPTRIRSEAPPVLQRRGLSGDVAKGRAVPSRQFSRGSWCTGDGGDFRWDSVGLARADCIVRASAGIARWPTKYGGACINCIGWDCLTDERCVLKTHVAPARAPGIAQVAPPWVRDFDLFCSLSSCIIVCYTQSYNSNSSRATSLSAGGLRTINCPDHQCPFGVEACRPPRPRSSIF